MNALERYHKLLQELIQQTITREIVGLRTEIYENFRLIFDWAIVDSDGTIIVDSNGVPLVQSI